ncbi:xanthine dehydrogenase 1 isoform X3 [Olea europaea subsp. europaea]|uniref:Xanthine dehydrogenase 1 isoform X3 n=1 Tax=Olea europaea subsp. europaea TaxID=158383 RepID=A0A8S0RBX0_OLEEU|nr:xanthine dehydrogenase 1 isoform X3 [Olea europaea subsp. europaea]
MRTQFTHLNKSQYFDRRVSSWSEVTFREQDEVLDGIEERKVGFTNGGKVHALNLEIFNNVGNSLDISHAMFHSDIVYEISNVRNNGKVCFTNFPSNTAFRGFGRPQGMLTAENWIQRIAWK